MAWRYQPITAKTRGQPFGPGTFNQLVDNCDEVLRTYAWGHLGSGLHNTLEIPRVVGAAIKSGSYALTDCQGNRVTLESGHNPATGTVILSHAAGFGLGANMVVQCNVRSEDVTTKPCTIGYTVASGTTTLYVKKLSSGLEGGNSWAALDGDFDFSLNTNPITSSDSIAVPTEKVQRGQALSDGALGWNSLVTNSAGIHEATLVEHNADGTHNSPNVARACGLVEYVGGTWLDSQVFGIDSISDEGDGHARINLASGIDFSSVSNMHGFAMAADGSAPCIINMLPVDTDTIDLYLYEMLDDGGWGWYRANRGFVFSIYGYLT